jgi:hypothetical protein
LSEAKSSACVTKSIGRAASQTAATAASAEALLERMLNKIDDLCAERDRLKREQPAKALGGRRREVVR